MYHDVVQQYWGEDLQAVKVKIAQIELPFEIYPASVDDISRALYSKGVGFRKYNTQSGTIYLNNLPQIMKFLFPAGNMIRPLN
jgi:hypothetical protein